MKKPCGATQTECEQCLDSEYPQRCWPQCYSNEAAALFKMPFPVLNSHLRGGRGLSSCEWKLVVKGEMLLGNET